MSKANHIKPMIDKLVEAAIDPHSAFYDVLPAPPRELYYMPDIMGTNYDNDGVLYYKVQDLWVCYNTNFPPFFVFPNLFEPIPLDVNFKVTKHTPKQFYINWIIERELDEVSR